MTASFALGLAGTIIGIGGLALTLLERRDRRNAVADERRERLEQAELLRRQVAASERQTQLEEAAHEAARAADVRVKRGGREGLGWSFDLVNTGPGAATRVKAWMVDAETGDPVSAGLELAGPLLPGEATKDRRLLIPLPTEMFVARASLALVLSWTDTRARERRDDHPIDL